MWAKSRAAIRDFASKEAGVTAIEFAVLGPIFLGVVLAIFQGMLAQYWITSLDRAVQKFAEELRGGSDILIDNAASSVMLKLCPNLAAGMDCGSLQVTLEVQNSCATDGQCWNSKYSDFSKGVRNPPTFSRSGSFNIVSTFNVGVNGESQYLAVFYPLPAMSTLWNRRPTVRVNGVPAWGILSTAMWINDPSVGVFGAIP